MQYLSELFESILEKLRSRVQQQEADAIFLQLLMRGSQVGLDRPPSDDNIDALIHGMMCLPANSVPTLDGPWNRRLEDSDATQHPNSGEKGMI